MEGDEDRSFRALCQAAAALVVAYRGRIERDPDDHQSRDRARQISEILALIDPHDIFEHDAFRRSFLNELEELELGGDVLT